MESTRYSDGESRDIGGISFVNVSGLSQAESRELYNILGVPVPQEEVPAGNKGPVSQVPETHIHAGSPINFFVESKLSQEEMAGANVGLPVQGRVFQNEHYFCQGLPPFGVPAVPVPVPLPVVSEDMTPEMAAYFASQPPPTMRPPGQNVNAIAFVPGMAYPLLPAPATTEQPARVPLLPFVPVGMGVPHVPLSVQSMGIPVTPTTTPVTLIPAAAVSHQPGILPQAGVKVTIGGHSVTNGVVPGNKGQLAKRPGIKDPSYQPAAVEMPSTVREATTSSTATDINKNVKPMPPASFSVPPEPSMPPASFSVPPEPSMPPASFSVPPEPSMPPASFSKPSMPPASFSVPPEPSMPPASFSKPSMPPASISVPPEPSMPPASFSKPSMPPASFSVPPEPSMPPASFSVPVAAPTVVPSSNASSAALDKSSADKKSQPIAVPKPSKILQNGVAVSGEKDAQKPVVAAKLSTGLATCVSTATTSTTTTGPVINNNSSSVVNGFSSPPKGQPQPAASKSGGAAAVSKETDAHPLSAPVSVTEPETPAVVPAGFPALGSVGGSRAAGGGFLNGVSGPLGVPSMGKNAVGSDNCPKAVASSSERQPGVASTWACEESKAEDVRPVLSFAAAAAAPPAKKSYAVCVKGKPGGSQAPASIVIYKSDCEAEKSAMSPTGNDVKSKETAIVSVEKDAVGMKLGEFLQTYKSNHGGVPLIPRGMMNTSNWCFMNSTLQAFMSAPQVYHLLKNMGTIMGREDRRQSSTPICDSLVKLVNEFSRAGRQNNSRRGRNTEVEIGLPFDPTYIRNLLISHSSFSKSYKNGRQEDAHEFFQALVNGSHEEQALLIKHAAGENSPQSNGIAENGCGGENCEDDGSDGDVWLKVDSKGKAMEVNMDLGAKTPMKQIFGGVSVRTIYQAGRGERQTHESWNDLTMESHHGSLVESLASLPAKETTQTDDGVEISHQTRIEVLPEVLVFTYKTFQYDHLTGGSEKIIKDFKFPVDLDIPKEILTPNARSRITGSQRSYKLCAVVSHLGKKATGGHYTTVTFDIASQCWLLKDDGLVSVIPESKVLQYYVDNVTHQMPYMLFYRQRHNCPHNGTDRH